MRAVRKTMSMISHPTIAYPARRSRLAFYRLAYRLLDLPPAVAGGVAMAKPKKMKLMAYLKTGPTAMHSGAWRHPATELGDIFSPERYEHIARGLEAARFDGCFYTDTR